MSATVHVNPLYLAGLIIATIFVIAYPLVLAIIARKRLHTGWRYFWFGVLIFLVFQLLTRVPAVEILQRTLAPVLRTSRTFAWIWAAILALTAGIFEEGGRYVGYRLFMRREEKTWSKAMMYGIGHGALESAVLIGVIGLLPSVINLIVWSHLDLNMLPPSARKMIVNTVNMDNALPFWFSLLGAWERLWAVIVHVAYSIIVLQVFHRQSIIWLFIAILAHAVVDFITAVLLPHNTVINALLVEGVIAVSGLIALGVIWRLRDRESSPQQAIGGETVAPGA